VEKKLGVMSAREARRISLDGFGLKKDVQIERFTFTENGRFHFSMFYIKRVNGEESVCVYWPEEKKDVS